MRLRGFSVPELLPSPPAGSNLCDGPGGVSASAPAFAGAQKFPASVGCSGTRPAGAGPQTSDENEHDPWIWRAVLAKLCVDDDSYTRLVAQVDDDGGQWREIAEQLLTFFTNTMVARWAPDFDGLVGHAENMVLLSLDASARDRGRWAPD